MKQRSQETTPLWVSDIEARFVCQACVWVKRRLYF